MDITQQSNLLIAGCCRDVAQHLDKVFANIHRIGNLFKSYRVFVVESDSSDNTLPILRDYSAQSEGKITVLSLGNLRSQYDQRTERLAICRNAILDHLWLPQPDWPPNWRLDYLFMLDMDNVTSKIINLEGIKSNFRHTDWAVMTPGSTNYYYDIWALRWPGKLDYDFIQAVEEAIANGMDPNQARQDKHIRWNTDCTTQPGQGLISVGSAFGCAAFYDVTKLKPEYRYSGWIDYHSNYVDVYGMVVGDRRYICEHVPFHQAIVADGGKIYINPEFSL